MAKMPNMKDMNKMMQMLQDMQKKAEEEEDAVEVEGVAGGEMVKVVMNGHKKVLSIEIAQEAYDPDDVDMLPDVLTAAFNNALDKVDDELNENEGMGGMPGMPPGFSIPGMPAGFPFPGM